MMEHDAVKMRNRGTKSNLISGQRKGKGVSHCIAECGEKTTMIAKNMYIVLFNPPECVGLRAMVYLNRCFTEQVQ